MLLSVSAISDKNEQPSKISYGRATIGVGIAFAWGIIKPVSVLGYIGATVSGTAGTVILFVGSKLTYQYARDQFINYSYRVAPLVSVGKATSVSVEEVYKKIKNSPCHEPFMTFMEFEDEKKAENLFKQYDILNDKCMGTCVELVRASKEASQNFISANTLSNSFDFKNALFFQALQVMKGELGKKNIHIICARTRNIGNLIDHEQFPVGYKESMYISASVSWEKYESTVDSFVSLKSASAEKPVIAIMVCIPKKGVGHAFFLYLSSDKFGFHDSICESKGGFFEYSNKQEYFEELKYRCIDLLGEDSNVLFMIPNQS